VITYTHTGDPQIVPHPLIAPIGTAKARIERAALELFVTGSIEGVTTKSIAQSAGVSEGLIYRHFKSKDDLARQLMQHIHDRLTALIRSHSDQSLDAAIPDIVNDYCSLADQDWALFAYHLLNIHRFPKLSNDSPIEAARDLIAFNQAAGRLPSGNNPMALAAMGLGVVLQTAQAKLMGALQKPLSDFAPIFERAVMAVLEDS